MAADLSNAPIPMRLGGREFRAFALRDVDHQELTGWCRREYLDRVKQVTDDAAIISIAISEALELTWGSGAGRKVIFTVRGMQKLASVLAREIVPYELMKVAGAIEEVSAVFAELHQAKSLENSVEQGIEADEVGKSTVGN